MAPMLHRRAQSVEVQTWLIAVCVVASVIVTALIVYLVVFRLRNKQYQEAAKRDPYLTRKEWARRRKLSNLQRLEEEEVQRQLILRKTLTSRTSSRPDSEDFETRQNGGSTEEATSDVTAEGRDEAWKRWEAGYGPDAENDSSEGHPLMEQHPAVKHDGGGGGRLHRSVSPTRALLVTLQEPEHQSSASLWARRLGSLQNSSGAPLRQPPDSPPRAPQSPAPAAEPLPERPHILLAHQPLHNSSPAPTRYGGNLQRQPTLYRSRAGSVDARYNPSTRNNASTSHSRASSHPVNPAPQQISTSTRARSNSASPDLSASLVSPPPPAALPHSASPRIGGSIARGPEQPRIPAQRDRSLSLVSVQTTQERAIHTRTRSHDMLPYRIPSPAQSPRRKPVQGTALRGRLSTSSLIGGTRAVVVSPVVSPVEEATLESERTPISPSGTLTMEGPSAIIQEMEGRLRMGTCDRDILPSQRPRPLQRDPIPSPPEPTNTNTASSEEDSQPSSFEGSGAFFEGPEVPLGRLTAQRGPRSSSPRRIPGHLEAENLDEVGTAFSFEVGDQIKELGISVRRLPERSSSPPVPASEKHEQDEVDSDEEFGSTFTFEEGARFNELGVSGRDPGTQRPNNPLNLPRSQHSGAEQAADGAYNLEGDSELKEMGLSLRDPPSAKQRHSPLRQLETPRLSKDRSRSFDVHSKNQPEQELTPEDIANRLRSRSFEPVAQGRWELQVSVLDQTGARHSREGSNSDYYSSASELGSPEENTFDAELPAEVTRPARPSALPLGSGLRPRQPTEAHAAHSRTPSTPLTSPDSDTSGLCRANFASPIKEKMLAEEQLPRSPPPPGRSPFSPSTASTPSRYSSQTSPREVGWSVASTSGWGSSSSAAERDDTMKEAWGSRPQAAGPTEKSKVSFRLSGPPDFMPAFF